MDLSLLEVGEIKCKSENCTDSCTVSFIFVPRGQGLLSRNSQIGQTQIFYPRESLQNHDIATGGISGHMTKVKRYVISTVYLQSHLQAKYHHIPIHKLSSNTAKVSDKSHTIKFTLSTLVSNL